MGLSDFVLLRRIEQLLRTDHQWLVKTLDNAPAFQALGRYSRWRSSNDRFGIHAEFIEPHISPRPKDWVLDRARDRLTY